MWPEIAINGPKSSSKFLEDSEKKALGTGERLKGIA